MRLAAACLFAPLLLLTGCSSADEPQDQESGGAPQTPPAYVGTWAFDPAWCEGSGEGTPIEIGVDTWSGLENQCALENVEQTPEGGWTATLSCQGSAEPTTEQIVMTPVGDKLALTYRDRPESETQQFTRCD